MSFVVIQHLDPTHPSALSSSLLVKKSALSVAEVRQRVKVQPDRICVIPPDRVLTISQGVLRLPRSSQKQVLPINSFMRSLAEDAGDRALGVILSGTGTGGTAGLEAIKARGGVTFIQDEKTANLVVREISTRDLVSDVHARSRDVLRLGRTVRELSERTAEIVFAARSRLRSSPRPSFLACLEALKSYWGSVNHGPGAL